MTLPNITAASPTSANRPFPHWRVWQVADSLGQHGLRTTAANDVTTSTRYDPVLSETISILLQWGQEATSDQQSCLDKRSLLHEIEESIVTCTFLWEGLQETTTNVGTGVIVVDACCGKGICSLLLSYLATTSLFANATCNSIARIVLFDRDTDINWNHIHRANTSSIMTAVADESEGRRPFLDLWPGIDLHDTDRMLDLLLSPPPRQRNVFALLGIHLCRGLSPSFLSLAQCLGRDRCIFACLAPCCLPSLNYAMQVRQYGSDPCPRCHFRHCGCCTEEKQTQKFLYCRRCRGLGHKKRECRAPPRHQTLPLAPAREATPMHRFGVYCDILATALGNTLDMVHLHDVGLVSSSSNSHENDWNAVRKAIYIVAF